MPQHHIEPPDGEKISQRTVRAFYREEVLRGNLLTVRPQVKLSPAVSLANLRLVLTAAGSSSKFVEFVPNCPSSPMVREQLKGERESNEILKGNSRFFF